jgi:Septum formation
MSSEEMLREAREDVYDDDPLEGAVTPAGDFDDGAHSSGPSGEDPAADTAYHREPVEQPDASLTTEVTPPEGAPLWAADPLQPTEPVPLIADPEAPPKKSPWGVILRAVVVAAIVFVGWTLVRNLLDSGTDVQSLQPGDCFLDFDGTEVSSVEVVACGEPHQFEVFANVVLPDGPYPGETQVDQVGFDSCLDEFPPYVGTDYESSAWFVTTLLPLEDGWPEDRTVNCLLVQPDEDDPTVPATVTGSARGTGA